MSAAERGETVAAVAREDDQIGIEPVGKGCKDTGRIAPFDQGAYANGATRDKTGAAREILLTSTYPASLQEAVGVGRQAGAKRTQTVALLRAGKDVDEDHASVVFFAESGHALERGFVGAFPVQRNEEIPRSGRGLRRARCPLKHVASGCCQDSLSDAAPDPSPRIDQTVGGEEQGVASSFVGHRGKRLRDVSGPRPREHMLDRAPSTAQALRAVLEIGEGRGHVAEMHCAVDTLGAVFFHNMDEGDGGARGVGPAFDDLEQKLGPRGTVEGDQKPAVSKSHVPSPKVWRTRTTLSAVIAQASP